MATRTLPACGVIALLSLAAPALAQSMNIDFGVATPAPSAGFGAAAASPGAWNVFSNSPTGLFDLAGNLTGATLSGTGGGFLGGNNDPLTFGDDEALMDDAVLIPFMETYTFTGLQAGTYNVFAYTWTVANLPTQLNVQNQGFQLVGGAWPGGYVPGITHSITQVNLGAGQPLTVQVFSVNGALGAINGVQLVLVPAPGAGALLAAAGLVAFRRRR